MLNRIIQVVKKPSILLSIVVVMLVQTCSVATYASGETYIGPASDTSESNNKSIPELRAATAVEPPGLATVLWEETKNSAADPTAAIGGKGVDEVMAFLMRQLGDADKITRSTEKAYRVIAQQIVKKGNIEKTLSRLRTGSRQFNKHMRYFNKKLDAIAQNESLISKNGGKLSGIAALRTAGILMALNSIATDGDALLEGDYKHNHESMRFIRDALLGSNLALNSFLLSPAGQAMSNLPIIGWKLNTIAMALGLSKDYVTSDSFADYMNRQDNVYLETANITIRNTNEYWTETFEGWLIDWYKYTGRHPSDEELALARERHKKWLENQNKGLGRKPGDNIGAYKPNIYLYPDEVTDIRVTFEIPNLLETVIPAYPGEWLVTAHSDGRLETENGQTYTFLFYESITYPWLYQTEEGWLIDADKRGDQMEAIMLSYGFTDQETADFVDYWTEKLDEDTDYAMYPQLTETVDIAMPILIEPEPDRLFRLWFAFEKGGIVETIATPQYIERDGFSAVEWGGVILP